MPRIDWRSILALLTAGIVVSTGTRIATPSIGSAVATASANIANDLSTAAAPHLGFDTFAYPGDDAMHAWLSADKYRWVGYYLPAPCHNDDSWEGKRDRLSQMGWGMAVIYVGQQTWGRTPGQKIAITRYVTKRVKQTVRTRSGKRVVRYVNKRVPVKVLISPRASAGSSCSSHLVSATRGVRDASDAVARTAAEGFAKGTVIFLDIERMDFVPKAMRDYYKAWTQRVLDDGRIALLHAGDEIRAMGRSKHQIDCEPRGLGERITEHSAENGESYSAVLQAVPWRIWPRGEHHHHECKREQHFDCDQVDGVGA